MSTSNPDEETDAVAEYGYTFGLAENRDIKTNDHRRFVEKEGKAAVIQDLKVCLLTPKGADPFDPEYGLDYFQAVGGNSTDATLKAAIEEAIGPDADDRVARIDEIDVDRTGNNRSDTVVTIELTLTADTQHQIVFAPQRGIQQ